MRRNAPNGRALSARAPRFAAGLVTEGGGDTIAFGVEEGAYRFLAAYHMILFGAFHASDLLPPKMRIRFGAIPSLLTKRE